MTTAASILSIPGPDEPWHTGTLLGFDLETTGKNPHTARIVTASIVLLDPAGNVRAHSEWLVNPGVEIPAEAAAVHGISTDYAREHGMDATTGLGEIVATLQDFMYQRVPIIAYNGVYDFTVLSAEMARRDMGDFAAVGIVDPYILDKHVDTYRKGKRTLEAVSEFYDVTLDQAHTSLADSVAAVQVAQAIVAKYPGQLDAPLETIFDQQIRWKAAQAASFEQFLRRKNPDATMSRDWPVEKLSEPDPVL